MNLIAIYGVNEEVVATQARRLQETLSEMGFRVFSVKYPVTEIAPDGLRIDAYLRDGNPEKLTPSEFQKLLIDNQKDFEPSLLEHLNSHDFVTVEGYSGSQIARGMTDGISKEELVAMREEKDLYKESIAILLDDSKNDSDDKSLNKGIHLLDLAKDFRWRVVDCSQGEEMMHVEICTIVMDGSDL